MTDYSTTLIERDLLERAQKEIEKLENQNPQTDRRRLLRELDEVLRIDPGTEPATAGVKADDDYYYEEFAELDNKIHEEINSLKSRMAMIKTISDAVTKIDCDWGASSVNITEEMNGTTRLEISAHTYDRCKPIDRLYDLEDEVTRFEANVEMQNTDAEQRLIHWTFTITI